MVIEEPDLVDEMRDENKRWTDEKKRRQQKKEQLEEKISAVAR